MWLQRIAFLFNILGYFIPVVTVGIIALHSKYYDYSSSLPGMLFITIFPNSIPFTILIVAGMMRMFKETVSRAKWLAVGRLLLFASTVIVHYTVIKSLFTNPADSGESAITFFVYPLEATVIIFVILLTSRD